MQLLINIIVEIVFVIKAAYFLDKWKACDASYFTVAKFVLWSTLYFTFWHYLLVDCQNWALNEGIEEMSLKHVNISLVVFSLKACTLACVG